MRRNSEVFWSNTKVKRLLAAGITLIILIFIIVAALWFQNLYSEYQQRNAIISESAPEQKTTLAVTFMNTENSWTTALVDAIATFEEANEDIDIEYTIRDENGFYEDTLNVLYARGELGDVVEMVNPSFFEREGLLSPMPDEVTELSDRVSSYGTTKYGVGTVAYTSGIVYNRDIFDKYGLSEPHNYEEFLEICEILKSHGITPIALAGANSWNVSVLFNYFCDNAIMRDNDDWFGDLLNGSSTWNDEEVRAAFTQMRELIDRGYIDPLWETTTDTMVPIMISNGTAAMSFSCGWMVNEIEHLDSSVNLGWFYLPDSDGEVSAHKEIYSYWTITKDCGQDEAKMDAARRFLEFFYSHGIYEQMCQSLSGMPISTRTVNVYYSSAQEEVIDEFINTERVFEISVYNSFVPQEFRGYLFDNIYPFLRGEIYIDNFCSKLDKEWNRDVAEVDNE